MKMLIKSYKISYSIPPLHNEINSEDFGEIIYDDDEKCSIINKYFLSYI